MYESPITLIETQMRIEKENNIFNAVKEIGVDVDKEELIKALKYDRGQYNKGYKDGYKAGYKAGIKRLCDRLGIIVEHSGLVIQLLEEMEGKMVQRKDKLQSKYSGELY